VVVVLGAGGVAFAVAWAQRGAEEASVQDALRELGGESAGDAGFLRPAAGVYVYAGTGTERLSVLGTSQQWGPNLPGVVRHSRDACWTFKIEYSTNHWQETTYCPRDQVLEELGGRTSQKFDFVVKAITDLSVFTCDPPGETIRLAAEPADHWQQSCAGRSPERGTNVRSTGTNTFVGIESIRIGGRSVRSYHYRYERSLTGDQAGTEEFEIWFAVRDGLPLREVRSVRVESPSPIGAVTYTEQGTYVLTSLTPRQPQGD